jgi:Na+-transporting NADH:ubiquinone oxidoreductase subunit A
MIQLDAPESVALDPQEISGFIPRLLAKEGDAVKRGSPILYHKTHPEIRLVAPVAGRLKEVRRGLRRVITDVVFEADGDDVVAFKGWSLQQLEGIQRSEARDQLCEGGLWPVLRTRPLDRMPEPTAVPQSIFICGMDSGPLQPGPDELLGDSDRDALQAAVHVLSSLTDGKVHVTHARKGIPKALQVEGVEFHSFDGPHPAGDAGVQINLIDPPRGAEKVWYVSAWDALLIGRLFLGGVFPNERIYAAVGAGVATPRLVRTLLGAPLSHIVGDANSGENRWIRGSVLTGTAVDSDRWGGWFARAVHVLPDVVEQRFMGWAMPALGEFSVHRAFLSGFNSSPKAQDLRPAVGGGRRAIVHDAWYERVVATPDIMPAFLFRSIMSGDLEESIQLGLLDITREEAALCSYICPSKVDFGVVLHEALENYVRET